MLYPFLFKVYSVNLIKKLSKLGKIHNYWFKFAQNNFELDDLLFENVAKDINKTFSHLKSFNIIALEHACPFGLYYASTYSSKCKGIICYPFRYYSKGSYDRRIWKLKTNNGYAKIIKKYDENYDNFCKWLKNCSDIEFNEMFERAFEKTSRSKWSCR